VISPSRQHASPHLPPWSFAQSLLTGVFPLLNDSGYGRNELTVIEYGMKQSGVSSLLIVIHGMR